jgi:hypothetical protein
MVLDLRSNRLFETGFALADVLRADRYTQCKIFDESKLSSTILM